MCSVEPQAAVGLVDWDMCSCLDLCDTSTHMVTDRWVNIDVCNVLDQYSGVQIFSLTATYWNVYTNEDQISVVNQLGAFKMNLNSSPYLYLRP